MKLIGFAKSRDAAYKIYEVLEIHYSTKVLIIRPPVRFIRFAQTQGAAYTGGFSVHVAHCPSCMPTLGLHVHLV